jgi:hypothetical protein
MGIGKESHGVRETRGIHRLSRAKQGQEIRELRGIGRDYKLTSNDL